MKIVLINNLYPPYIVGGNEMLARDVVEALRLRGHEVHVITGRGRDLPEDDWTHGVLDLDLDRKEEIFLGGREPTPSDAFVRHLYHPSNHRAVARALRHLKPDLVVVWNLYMASMAPLIAARSSGIPVVVHTADKWLMVGLFDVSPFIWPSMRSRRSFIAIARRVVQPLLRFFALPVPIVSISGFMRQVYVEAGFPGDIEVEHLGVATDVFRHVERPPPGGGTLRFLYVGALWEGKGPQVAIRALARAAHAEGMPPVHLDVVGQGTDGFISFLKDEIAAQGLEAHVTLRGFVPRDQLARLFQSHDVLLFPSTWDEPFAAVPIEAMASGLAVIATTAGGTPEAIADGETGLLVPPGDAGAMATAMVRLARDPALRRALGSAAARVVRERWDFAQYVDRLESRYRALTGGDQSR